MRYNTLVYNTAEFNFCHAVGQAMGARELDNLHWLTDEKYTQLFEVGHDSSTVFHKMFYDRYRAGWPKLQVMYDDFIRVVVSPWYQDDFLYQKFPTFRVHLPGNIAVGRFHNDAEFGHPVGEVNYIIPLTDSDYTSSVWVESEPGREDYRPMKLQVGQLLMFNGNELSHGNKVNQTEKTRVSMDFRVLPINKYDGLLVSESVTTKTKFVEGQYYVRFVK